MVDSAVLLLMRLTMLPILALVPSILPETRARTLRTLAVLAFGMVLNNAAIAATYASAK
jgi:hypothetical protein